MRYLLPYIFLMLLSSSLWAEVQSDSTTLKIIFKNTANHKPIVLRDSNYITPSGETYQITKLKYYISNIKFGDNILKEEDNVQLITEPMSTSFSIPVKAGSYRQIHFLLGVDSLLNCSGAQEGALDPMNDMFWTWNSGYVMFKLEGISENSRADKNRIEHHIGGYRNQQNIAKPVTLSFEKTLVIQKGEKREIVINVDLDQYWKSVNNILISEKPVCTLPGELAKTIAANFSNMFSIQQIR